MSSLKKVVVYWPNSMKCYEFFYNEARRIEGKYQSWHSNSVLSCECLYKEGVGAGNVYPGVLHGRYERWYESGKLYMRCCYKENKIEGKMELFSESGKLDHEYYFVGGVLEGVMTHFYVSGEVKVVSEYGRGVLTRVCACYDEKGRDCSLQGGRIEVWRGGRSNGVEVFVKLVVENSWKRVTDVDIAVLCRCSIERGRIVLIIDGKGVNYKTVVINNREWGCGEEISAEEFQVYRYQDQCREF
ncbi:MAG: hypothetical protein Harvfovirus62_7 [Harvfovirus sp.]|uniref:MORN repeat-containing protein n=1 Tax=Harvfovirus sp. TaxID=2487768 RepID=A0A3G5A5L1_9VIRU|nr:MAG: hypothetical protein Harvfovirus62_7 [Harvfovirus sp.]